MASVIEEAVIRILPSFKDFKPELEAKLKEFTEGEKAEVRVKLQVDARALHNSIKDSLAGITNTASTVKLRAEFDHAQMKRDFTTAIGKATEGAASTTAAARVRIDVNQQYLKASLQTGVREAIRQVDAQTGEGVKVKVEPIIDRRKLDAQLAELSKKTITVKVRYDVENAPTLGRGGVLGGGSRGRSDVGTGPEAGRRGGQKGGSSFGRIAAEFINALPGVGGIGPHAAEALVAGVTAGAPAIAAALSAAVSAGISAGVIGAGITVAAQDPKVRNAAGLLGSSIMGTLSGAAQPFRDSLLTVIPQIGHDVQSLQPQLHQIFSSFAPSLGRIESGLLGGLQNALNPKAAANAADTINQLADKLPDMGTAVGRFVEAVTDPKAASFFKQLINFVDELVVDVGNLVRWLAKVNEAFSNAGVYTVIGAVLKALATSIGAIAGLLGPGFTAVVVAAGAGLLLMASRAKTAFTTVAVAAKEATAAVSTYATAMRAYSFNPVAAGRATAGSLRGGTSALSAIGRFAGPAALVAAPIAGSMIGDAVGGKTGSIISGIGSGAFVGGLLGSALPGPGTAIGAVAGGAIGGLIAALKENTDALKTKTGDINAAAETFAQTGGVTSDAVNQIMHGSDQALKTLVQKGPGAGISLPSVFTAVSGGDPGAIKSMISALRADQQTQVNKVNDANGHYTTDELKAAHDRAQKDQDLITVLGGVQTAAQLNRDSLDRNSHMLSTTPPWAATVLEKAQGISTGVTPYGISNVFTTSAGLNVAGEATTVNTVTTAYRNYILAQRATGDARYQAAQTLQQTSVANEAALHGVLEAEHGVAQAHFATEMAQRSLTEARKEAIQNLVELRRQIRDIGDNEEQLKINLVEANLAERQTRGLDADSLVRREAVLRQHQAANALADFRADEPTLRAKAKLAEQQGVEGSTPVLQAQNALSEAHRNEHEQLRNVKIARDSYNNTVEASRRANELAQRAIDDAGYAEGQQAGVLRTLQDAYGLATDKVKGLYEASKAIDRTFNLDLQTNAPAALNEVGDLYEGVALLAAQYGITVPDWNTTVQTVVGLPPSATGPAREGAGGGLHSGPTFRAEGGFIDGWSPHDKADNLLSWVTAGEFVVNAKQSRKHRMLLEAINAGHYADGGLVLPTDKMIDRWSAPIRAQLAALSGITGGSGGDIGAVQSWLRTTVDPLPYVLGGVGPGQYDCSGLVGEVWARLTGNGDYQRYFVTGGERQFLAAHGFKDGTGTFTVGFSGEHTMGTLGGLPFEAANPRSGIHIGSGTSDVTSFPNVMYLPQLGSQFVGGSGYPPGVDKVTVGGVWGQFLRKILTNARTLADQRTSGGDAGLPSGGVEQWRGAVIQALSANGLATTPDMVGAVLRQIQTESGGNPGALQQVHDVNWPNNRARGLLQVIPPTFDHYKFPGHGDPFNGLDSLLAALSYAKHRYGSDLTGVLGHGHGYDQGGWLRDVGINTSGLPEAVLTHEESKAYVKHAEAVSGNGGEMRLDDYSIARLAQALSTRPIPVHVDGRKVADAVIPHLERRF